MVLVADFIPSFDARSWPFFCTCGLCCLPERIDDTEINLLPYLIELQAVFKAATSQAALLVHLVHLG